MSKSEMHLFILWEFARNEQERIINDIKESFEIVEIFDLKWSKDKFAHNLTRFYGTNLPPNSFKEVHCGKDRFLLIAIRDNNPTYESRETSHGPRQVNSKTFDKKQLYRSWTGGGHRVHATDTEKEFDHDMALLLGENSSTFKKNYADKYWDGTFKPLAKDLEGSGGWKNIHQLIFVLNNTVNYIIMRNFESIPDEYTMKEHGDIDLLTDSPQNLQYILNAGKVFPEDHRVLHATLINNEKVLFDIRFVGDEYYEKAWEEKLLEDKVMDSNGFYRPNDEDYFYSLLYHAAIHKKSIAKDYQERLPVLGQKIGVNLSKEVFTDKELLKKYMFEYMNKYGFSITKPIDISVYYNKEYL